jgi:hypothetical protein
MAFSSLADNQMVTYEEATVTFVVKRTVKSGGTQALTKAMAFNL